MEIIKDKIEFEQVSSKLFVKLSGEIDHHTAGSIKKSIDSKLFSARPEVICLDLSKVSFMDSSGLGLILGRYQLAKEIGCSFVLKNPNENVMKILKIAGCDKLFETQFAERKKAQ